MSRGYEEILELKDKITQCNKEVLRLQDNKELWLITFDMLELTKDRVVDDLKRKSNELSKLGKELDDLYHDLKFEEKYETRLKCRLDDRQTMLEQLREDMEVRVRSAQVLLNNAEMGLSVTREKRVEMERRVESVSAFYEAVYSTLKSKKSNGVSLVEEAQLDLPGGRNEPQLRRRGSKISP